MRFLFLHPNFPAQFRHLAVEIAKQEQHQVVFGTARVEGSLPGVHKEIYAPNREVRPETHNYIKPLATAVLQGQAVYRIADKLKSQGFIPDIVYGHSGWGCGCPSPAKASEGFAGAQDRRSPDYRRKDQRQLDLR